MNQQPHYAGPCYIYQGITYGKFREFYHRSTLSNFTVRADGTQKFTDVLQAHQETFEKAWQKRQAS